MCPTHTHLPVCLSAGSRSLRLLPTFCVWQTPDPGDLTGGPFLQTALPVSSNKWGASPCLCALGVTCVHLYHRSPHWPEAGDSADLDQKLCRPLHFSKLLILKMKLTLNKPLMTHGLFLLPVAGWRYSSPEPKGTFAHYQTTVAKYSKAIAVTAQEMVRGNGLLRHCWLPSYLLYHWILRSGAWWWRDQFSVFLVPPRPQLCPSLWSVLLLLRSKSPRLLTQATVDTLLMKKLQIKMTESWAWGQGSKEKGEMRKWDGSCELQRKNKILFISQKTWDVFSD